MIFMSFLSLLIRGSINLLVKTAYNTVTNWIMNIRPIPITKPRETTEVPSDCERICGLYAINNINPIYVEITTINKGSFIYKPLSISFL